MFMMTFLSFVMTPQHRYVFRSIGTFSLRSDARVPSNLTVSLINF